MISESEPITTVVSKKILEFSKALENWDRFTLEELNEYIIEIENLVDVIVTENRPDKLTDERFRAYDAVIREYESLMEAIREAVLDRDFYRAKSMLPKLDTTIRRLVRLLSVIATGSFKHIAGTEELELVAGDMIAVGAEDLKDLNPLERKVLYMVYRDPLKEIHLNDIAMKLGFTGKDAPKKVSQLVTAVIKKVPHLVELVPDPVREGFRLRWKV